MRDVPHSAAYITGSLELWERIEALDEAWAVVPRRYVSCCGVGKKAKKLISILKGEWTVNRSELHLVVSSERWWRRGRKLG